MLFVLCSCMAGSVVAYVPCPVSSDAGRAFLQASEVKVPVDAARACVVRVLTYIRTCTVC